MDQKEKNRQKYNKSNRRRQDHGTRIVTNHNRRQRWFDHGYFDYDEIRRQARRRIFRRGGEEWLAVSDD